MGAVPLPEGNNAADLIRRLRAVDAELFGSLTLAGTLTLSEVGVIRTTSEGKRIELFNPDGDDLFAFYSGNAKEAVGDHGLIYLTSSDGSDFINFVIQSPKLSGSAGNYGWSNFVMSGSGDAAPASVGINTFAGGTIDSLIGLNASAASGNPQIQLKLNSVPELDLTLTAVKIPNAYNATSGSAANVVVDSAGQLFRSTSTEEDKDDVSPWSSDSRILDVQPVTFYAKKGNKKRGAPMKRSSGPKSLGLTYENVKANFPKGAIVRDKGLDWNAITTALLAEVQRLEARVTALESR